jgi:dienelactone hydrolase
MYRVFLDGPFGRGAPQWLGRDARREEDVAAKKGRLLWVLAFLVLAGWAFRAPLLRLSAGQALKFRWPGQKVETAEVRFPSGNLTVGGTLYAPAPPLGLYPALVITHGGTRFGRKLALYGALARKLSERGYVVLTFDFRGFGDSERPRRFETSADLDFVRDVTAAVDYLTTLRRVDPSRISVIGHSFGAGVAVAAALRDRRLGRAVSIAPGRNTAGRFFGPGAADPGYPSTRMSRDMGVDPPIPPAVFDPHLKDYVAEAVLDYPRHPPILLVDGEKEPAEDLAFLKDVAARMTEPKGYVTIAGADHYFGTRQDQQAHPTTVDYDARILDPLVEEIDGWLKKDFPKR